MSGSRYAPAIPLRGHLLADVNGNVLPHRLVLLDKVGSGSHPCHWCRRSIAWQPKAGEQALVTDHLDDVRDNNVPENLVPSCNRCNTWRGRWPESFARFLASAAS